MRWTEHFDKPASRISRANTFIYELNFRRVKVAANSLQVDPTEISLLSTAVRVGGSGLTWIRDTRDSPLDAHRGTYTSFQEFLSQIRLARRPGSTASTLQFKLLSFRQGQVRAGPQHALRPGAGLRQAPGTS
jgi:hypothetical protein